MSGDGLPSFHRNWPKLLAVYPHQIWLCAVLTLTVLIGQALADDRFSGGRLGLGTGRQVWRYYDLTGYVTQVTSTTRPEQTVVQWILKATGTEAWHGEDVAVLSVTPSRLRVFHTPEVQQQVAELVKRFVHPVKRHVSVHVQFVVSTDLSWRNGIAHLLIPVATGPEGQQVWLLTPEDASLLRSRLALNRHSRLVLERRELLANGETTIIDSEEPLGYIAGLELSPGAFPAYRPVLSRLNQGVRAVLTPLWTADGSALDLDTTIQTLVVRKLHQSRSAAPLTTGKQTAMVQVPEVVATELRQTLRWPPEQVLLISLGVQPGILDERGGLAAWVGLRQTTELLIFVKLDRSTITPLRLGQEGTGGQ